MSFPPIAITLDGASCTLTREQAAARVGTLYGEVLTTDEAAVRAQVRLGALLLQLRPRFGRGEWSRFLKAAGVRDLKRVPKAIRYAEEQGDGHGHFNREEAVRLLKIWNAEHPECKPLDTEQISMRSMDTLMGYRSGRPAGGKYGGLSEWRATPKGERTTGREKSGAPHAVQSAPNRPMTEHEKALAMFDDVPHLHATSSVETAAVETAAHADRDARVRPAAGSGRAPSGPGGGGQMTLEVEYELARRRFERVMRSPELVAEFNAWAAERGLA